MKMPLKYLTYFVNYFFFEKQLDSNQPKFISFFHHGNLAIALNIYEKKVLKSQSMATKATLFSKKKLR